MNKEKNLLQGSNFARMLGVAKVNGKKGNRAHAPQLDENKVPKPRHDEHR